MPPHLIREVAARWGWDPDALTDEQRDQIVDQLQIWAQ
jgi:hypothetical protein